MLRTFEQERVDLVANLDVAQVVPVFVRRLQQNVEEVDVLGTAQNRVSVFSLDRT